MNHVGLGGSVWEVMGCFRIKNLALRRSLESSIGRCQSRVWALVQESLVQDHPREPLGWLCTEDFRDFRVGPEGCSFTWHRLAQCTKCGTPKHQACLKEVLGVR